MKQKNSFFPVTLFLISGILMISCSKDELIMSGVATDDAFAKKSTITYDEQMVLGPKPQLMEARGFLNPCGSAIEQMIFDHPQELHANLKNTGSCTIVISAFDSVTSKMSQVSIPSGESINQILPPATHILISSYAAAGGNASGEMILFFEGDLNQASNGTNSGSGLGSTFQELNLNGIAFDAKVVYKSESISDSELGAGYNIGISGMTEFVSFVGFGLSGEIKNANPASVGLACTGNGAGGCYGVYQVYLGAEPVVPPVSQDDSDESKD